MKYFLIFLQLVIVFAVLLLAYNAFLYLRSKNKTAY